MTVHNRPPDLAAFVFADATMVAAFEPHAEGWCGFVDLLDVGPARRVLRRAEKAPLPAEHVLGDDERWLPAEPVRSRGLGGVSVDAQAEVLVCDLVSFVGSNGGAILQADGKTVSIADAPAVEAVQLMVDMINKHGLTPPDALSWDEEPSRRPFTSGQSAFLRNWSYTYAIAQDASESTVVDKVGVAARIRRRQLR